MSKVLAGTAAFALTAMLALPGSANAGERGADGLRAKDATAMTEFSSRRIYRRHIVVRRAYGSRFGYRRYGGPRYAYGGYWRPRYAWGYPSYGYPYFSSPYYAGYYRPWYRPYPAVSIGFGFGPRWW